MQKTKRLWEREFSIVNQGISEEQVTKFVDDLQNKYRSMAAQQQHFLSLGTLSEKASTEAKKIAKDIEAKARREAKSEAEDIIRQAKEKAKEILTLGEKRAQEAKQQEIESILHTARKIAAITEAEAKQQAQSFLIKSKEAIESDLREEVKESYESLLSSLQDSLSQESKLQVKWKGKTLEPWSDERLDLEYEEANSTPTAESFVDTESVNQDEDNSEPVLDSVSPTEISPEDVGFVTPEGMDSIDKESDTEALPKEPSQEITGINTATPQPTSGFTYHGEVEIIFIPPMEISAMSEIHERLQKTPDIKIIRTIGSWEIGTRVVVFLEKPLPLADILTTVTAIEIAAESFDKQRLTKRTSDTTEAEDKQKGNCKIFLKMRQNP